MSCAKSQNEYTGDGSTKGYLFTFEYEQQAEVQVEVLNTDTGEYEVKQQDDATYGWAFNGLTAITFNTAPADGVKFKIARNTIIDPLQAKFYPGSSIRAQDLNNNFEQLQRAIQDNNCDRETLKEYVDENYWDKLDDTLKAGEAWVADDSHIATNLRNDERYLKLAGPGANVTTEAEQLAGTVPDNDTNVLSNAASIERHDNILSTADPGNQSQPGKLWMNTSTETQNYWNDTIGAWVDTSGVGPVGPQGPQGPSGTIEVGTTTTSAPGGAAQVTNTGPDDSNAIFNFTIPRGEQGPVGPTGPEGPQGEGVQFRGQIDATQPGSAPADAVGGDLWVNNADGVVDASWGAPAAGTAIEVGWRLALTTAGNWEALEPADPRSEFWTLDGNGVLTPVVDAATSVPEELFIGGTTLAPVFRLDPNTDLSGTGFNNPAANQLGVKVGGGQIAAFTGDGLNVGPSIQLQGTNETIVVGNMRIDTNQINHVGQWTIDINNNDLMVFRDNDITTIEDLDVEGTTAPGFTLNTTIGNVYRIDTVVAGAEVWWASVGAPNPQVGAYFTATTAGAVAANQQITWVLDPADLHVAGNASVGGGLTVNNITTTGRVGIGNSSPGSFYSGSNQLVVGNTGDQGITIKTGTSDIGRLHFADGTTGNQAYRGRIEYVHASDYMQFGTAGRNSDVVIDNNGRLGIGTQTPGELLHVVNPTTTAEVRLSGGSSAANYSQIGFYGGTTRNGEIAVNSSYMTLQKNSGVICVKTGGTERLRFSNTGAFGLSGENYGSSGQVLTSQGSGSAPQWATPAVPAGVPSGAVQYFAQNSAPSGWLKANGAAVSRTTYAALFAAIGTTYGSGNGSSTFNVPDLRAEFIRGWDDGRNIDSGRGFGSFQADEFKSHTHPYAANRGGSDYGGSNPASGSPNNGTTSATGGVETRPRNVALLACIKF